jgi:hypothetical protein
LEVHNVADATERMHYFARQFLRATDFQVEQEYHLDRRRRHNLGFHSGGVVQGLQVVASNQAEQVTVQPGWAVDALGREIVLATARENLALPGGAGEVWISYPDPEPLGPQVTEAGVSGSNRVLEEPVVTVVPPGTVPANALRLAAITGGTIDNDVRTLAGLKNGAVGEANLADNAVGSRALAEADAGAVQDPNTGSGVKTAHLKDRAVTEPKLADNAVSNRTILAGGITEPKLANAAVSEPKLANNAVSAAKLRSDAANNANRAVGPNHLQNDSVVSRALAPADAGNDQTLTTGAGVKTGHLKDEAVSAAKLAEGAVTAAKLQAHPTDSALRAVGPQHVQNGSVSIAQLRATLIFDQQIAVPAAPAPGQVAEAVVLIDQTDSLSFHLISVHYVGPRPQQPGFVSSSFTWTHRNTLFKIPPPNAPYVHRHELLVQNPNTVAITVACRVYRLLEQ